MNVELAMQYAAVIVAAVIILMFAYDLIIKK